MNATEFVLKALATMIGFGPLVWVLVRRVERAKDQLAAQLTSRTLEIEDEIERVGNDVADRGDVLTERLAELKAALPKPRRKRTPKPVEGETAGT